MKNYYKNLKLKIKVFLKVKWNQIDKLWSSQALVVSIDLLIAVIKSNSKTLMHLTISKIIKLKLFIVLGAMSLN